MNTTEWEAGHSLINSVEGSLWIGHITILGYLFLVFRIFIVSDN